MLDSEENKAKLAEWNKNTSEEQQAALTEALSDKFGESVIDDINEQMSVSMSTAMQRIADNLNARNVSETEPEFSSPEESTVDAAGSEFADTTAEDEGPIYEFSED